MASFTFAISSGVTCLIPCDLACSAAFLRTSSSSFPWMTCVHPDDGSTFAHSIILPMVFLLEPRETRQATLRAINSVVSPMAVKKPRADRSGGAQLSVQADQDLAALACEGIGTSAGLSGFIVALARASLSSTFRLAAEARRLSRRWIADFAKLE